MTLLVMLVGWLQFGGLKVPVCQRANMQDDDKGAPNGWFGAARCSGTVVYVNVFTVI